jgi:leucyl-tRNA synthetase
VEGASRFLRRVWTFGHGLMTGYSAGLSPGVVPSSGLPAPLADVRREVHTHLKQANYDFGKHQFNTVVSAAMKILNGLEKLPREDASSGAVAFEGFSILLRLLSPVTPHIAHALWRECGFGDDILTAPWPEPQADALAQDEIELMLQINGKLRGSLRVAADASTGTIEAAALTTEAAQRFMEGKPAKKVVIVPGRLVNIVA